MVKNLDLISRVKRTILRHHQLENLGRLGVAISGGADSVCLLLLMRELSVETAILHVNHMLRGEESEADETFVRALGARFHLPVHIRRSDAKSLDGNLEQEARRTRYEFYRESIAVGSGRLRRHRSHALGIRRKRFCFACCGERIWLGWPRSIQSRQDQ